MFPSHDRMASNYNQVQQTRTTISSADTWTAVNIPIGSRFPLLACEDTSVTFRVSVDNTIGTDQGTFIPAKGAYTFEGVNTAVFTIYVSLSSSATMILIFTKD